MEYERMSKSYAWGLHKIYELVINTDPCYAYLLTSNSFLDHKLVIAHVFGHSDFFKNNAWFAHTDRRMLDTMANNASKVARIAERHGHEKVENFVDLCLSIDNLIDYHSPYIARRSDEIEDDVLEIHKLPARGYMDRYINPEEEIARQKEAHEKRQEELKNKFPLEPEKDVMLFLLEHAPLERWQQQIVSIVRSEAYYFVPQRMTKIMNEGWASYWHSTMMTQDICGDHEIIDFACTHAGTMVMSPTSFNPYKVGIELFRDIEDRWNKGCFGLEYERCESMAEKSAWDKELGLGREKIFQVRKIYNDVTFLDEYLTPEFCERQKLFTFGYDRRKDNWEIKSREFQAIKDQLLGQLTNFGQPAIYVEDGNHQNRGELMLWHKHDGKDLKPDYARATLENLVKFWNRPVHIRTKTEDKTLIWSHDGESFEETSS
jgi:stage V sporulation protein R